MDEQLQSMMKSYIHIFFFVIVTVFTLELVSCDEHSVSPQIDYKPELNVFALLILNNQQKVVRVERSYRIDEYLPESVGIANAQVTIRNESQTVHFTHTGEGSYRDTDNALLLKAGTTYHLVVEVPDGRKVSGGCTMPAKPKIINPKSYQEVSAHRVLDVQWQAADFAHRYLCFLTDLEKDFTPRQYSDSTATTFFAFLFAEPDVYTLKVAACDQNYYDHIRTNENNEDIIHLKGGLGVFGALAYDEVTFLAK